MLCQSEPMDFRLRSLLVTVVLCWGCVPPPAVAESQAGVDTVPIASPQAPPPTPTRILTGRVLANDSQPVAGATVTLLMFDGKTWQQRHAETRQDGAFRFEAVPRPDKESPSIQVLARKAGFGLGWTYWPDASDNVDIPLGRSSQLAVRLVGPDHQPVSDLELRVGMLLWSGRPGPLGEFPELADGALRTRSDRDGRAVFADLPAGSQLMLAHHDERFAQFGPGHWIVLGDGPTVDGGTLTLARAATISGTVRYEGADVRPVANVAVHAQPRGQGEAANGDTRTDAQGRFTLRQMAEGAFDLRCYLDGEAQRDWASPPRTCVVAAGQALTDQDLTLTRGARIIGRVTAADTGEGVAGIPVGAEPRPETSPGGNASDESGPDGTYALRVVPGNQYVYLATTDLQGYALPDKHEVNVEVKEGETLTLDFALPPLATSDFVSGRVVDSQGQPVPGAEIYVCLPKTWMFVRPDKADARGNFRLRVPEERQWEGRSRPAGAVEVRIFARAAGGLVTAQGVDARGGARDIVVRLADHALGQVSGWAVDEDGRGIGNAPVRVYVSLGDLPGCNRIVRTDAHGDLTVDDLWPGLEYSLTTEMKGYTAEGSRALTLAPGEHRQLPDWRLAPARLPLAGMIVDAAGKPVAGATVNAQAQRVDTRPTTSDARGMFRLEGFAEEWMWLSVNYRLPTADMVRVKAGDEHVLVELPAPGNYGGEASDRPEHFEATIGQPAPAIRPGAWINVAPLAADTWRAKVVLLDFWAVTCGGCIPNCPRRKSFGKRTRAAT